MTDQQRLEMQAIREQFEADAAPLGFDLTRTERNFGGEPWSDYVDQTTGHRWGGWLAIAQRDPIGAEVYPPDGTVSPYTVINLGMGKVVMSPSLHNGHTPALWFGKGGKGMNHVEDYYRPAHAGETLAAITLANVDGLDVLIRTALQTRAVSFPLAAPFAFTPMTQEEAAATAMRMARLAADMLESGQ